MTNSILGSSCNPLPHIYVYCLVYYLVMKTKNSKITSFIVAMMFLTGVACAQDKETRDLRNFDEIRVSEGIEVIAQKGSENKIEIEVDYIELDDVITEVRGGRLHIHLERGRYRRKWIKAYLTYTDEPTYITANTAAEVVFKDKITTRSLDINTSTSGFVELEVEVDRLDLSASTSGRIDIKGKTDDIRAGASTGGTIYAYEVEAVEGSAKANTGADVRIRVEDFLRASAGTGGSVKYKGRPKTDVRSNTGGSVRRSN